MKDTQQQTPKIAPTAKEVLPGSTGSRARRRVYTPDHEPFGAEIRQITFVVKRASAAHDDNVNN